MPYNHRIEVRLTKDEKIDWTEKAYLEGFSNLSEFIRMRVRQPTYEDTLKSIRNLLKNY